MHNRYLRIVLSLTISVLFSQSLSALSPSSWETILADIDAFAPRIEAAGGERALIEYIQDFAAAHSLETQDYDFSGFRNGHSFSKVLSIEISGDREDTVWIAVALDQPRDRAPGKEAGSGNLGVTAALSLLQRYSEVTPELSLRFLFLGSEHGSLQSGGSRMVLSQYLPGEPVAVLYLDLDEARLPLHLHAGARGSLAPLWLLEGTADALAKGGLTWGVPTALLQLQRIGLGPHGSLIEPYLHAGIPALKLSDTESTYSNTIPVDRFGRRFEGAIDSFLSSHAEGLPSAWDRNYLFFRTQNGYFSMNEAFHVATIFVVLALTILYGSVARSRTRRYRSTIARNLWNIPGFAAVCFAFLFITTLILRQLLHIRAFPELWSYYPIPFFLLKIIGAIFLFTLTLQVVMRLPFSKNGSFYSATALLLLFAGVVVSAIVDVAISYYFIWAFLCAFLFSVSRRRRYMFLLMVLAPTPLLLFTFEALSLPELRVAETLLLSPVRGNLLQTLIVLPFLLMFVRMDFLIPHPSPGKRRWTLKLLSSLTGFSSGALLILLLGITPFSEASPRPVLVADHNDIETSSRTVTVRTPNRLGDVDLVLHEDRYELSSLERQERFTTAHRDSPLDVQVTTNVFLDRKRVRLRIDADRPLWSIRLRLLSEEPLFLLHSELPTRLTDDRRRGEVFIGANPELPLTFEFTVPADAELALEFISVPFTETPASYIVSPGDRLLLSEQFRELVILQNGPR
ncbi:MAG: hypothetical protein EA428_10025 [Spirochaetaceae bacterium]|nr:MAG: hypothetical protein EA428_10025 [Spirochaetaceae bacterium]